MVAKPRKTEPEGAPVAPPTGAAGAPPRVAAVNVTPAAELFVLDLTLEPVAPGEPARRPRRATRASRGPSGRTVGTCRT